MKCLTSSNTPGARGINIKHYLVSAILLLLFCVECLFMLLAPTIYYAYNNTVEINATVVDMVTDEKTRNVKIYVSYQYGGQQFEDVYYRSVESYRSPSTGGIIAIKIDSQSPVRTVRPFAELIYKPTQKAELLIIVVSALLLWSCIKTIFKHINRRQLVDRKWVQHYVTRRELLHMVLATSAIMMNYIVDTSGAFYAVFTVGAYIIIRATIRMISLNISDNALRIGISRCRTTQSEYEGRDLDSSTLTHRITTDSETFTFYGYGTAAFFCKKLKPSDELLIVSLGNFSDPYMLCRLEKETLRSIKNTRQKLRPKPTYIKIITAAALVLVWIMLPRIYDSLSQCEHVFYSQTIYAPSTKANGRDNQMCIKCFDKQTVDIPRLENIIAISVKEKVAKFSDSNTVEVDGFSVEMPFSNDLRSITYMLDLTNTGNQAVKNLSALAIVYDRNGQKLGDFEFNAESVLLPGETSSIEATHSYVWIMTDTAEEKLANELAEAALDELLFDFEIRYE